MKIYIVDYLGVHCGMHYYNDAFKQVLEEIPEVEVRILSNYKDGEDDAFFLHQYKGSVLNKISSLLTNLYRLKRFVKQNKEALFIYLTYGNKIDIPFLKIISKAPHHAIDIHEAIGQDVDHKLYLKKQLKSLYASVIKTVITHSQRTNDFLDEFGYKEKRFFVPHFRYRFSKKFERSKVGKDIITALSEDKINILFFGNINYNKGVDILLDSFNKLDKKDADRINIIVAGKDFDGTCYKVTPLEDRSVNIILRHIEDDELIYLYQNTQFLALPYRKTSQSGVLEMAFYFNRPIIASNIPYFNKVLTEFPSFGVLTDNFTDGLKQVTSDDMNIYFKQEDMDRYTHREAVTKFVNDFKEWLYIL